MAKNEPLHSQEESDIRALYVDERTQKKIHEHLTNENDVITEQDIANITTGVTKDNDIEELAELQEQGEGDKTQMTEEEKEAEDKTIKDNEDPEIETPWNILGS